MSSSILKEVYRKINRLIPDIDDIADGDKFSFKAKELPDVSIFAQESFDSNEIILMLYRIKNEQSKQAVTNIEVTIKPLERSCRVTSFNVKDNENTIVYYNPEDPLYDPKTPFGSRVAVSTIDGEEAGELLNNTLNEIIKDGYKLSGRGGRKF